jgi:hypothetical protein
MRLFLALFPVLAAAAPAPQRLSVQPENPLLFGKGSEQRLVVIAHYPDGSQSDITAQASLHSEKPAVAEIAGPALLRAVSNGAARIRISYGALSASTAALVQRADSPVAASFAADVLPVLTKLGCNGASCHGSLNGQAGFKLSLFGYDPDFDWDMIVNKNDGRRVDRARPEASLLLAKPTFAVKHGGGKLLKKESPEYARLLAWIQGGMARATSGERRVVSLRLFPQNPVIYGKGSMLRFLVTARFSDGSEGDVTSLVNFKTNDDSILAVSPSGVATAVRGGETAVVVRAPGVLAATKAGVVIENKPVPRLEEFNFIDRHVGAKLQSLHIPPSAIASDEEFLRRVFLDVIGLIPSAAQARRFLEDRSPDKRASLVDDLLQRPEYADYWATYWGDHLSNTRQLLYNKGPYTFTQWLYKTFRKNTKFDDFARQLLVSSGNMYEAAATSYYPLMRKELDLAAMTSQLFLGISIECARCHNHPLEKWTQDDFSGMAAFFSQVRYKGAAGPRNNERILYVDFARQFQHPDTKKVFLPKPLGGPYMTDGDMVDRRELLANWLTSPSNLQFGRAIVNRMWRKFMGRGLVEPVDDFRATNPPSNPKLLDQLARDFIANRYDLHHLIRTITASRAYQTSSVPVPGNRDDTMAYSRYYPKRLDAEQLLDSIGLATGVWDQFRSCYPGTRAMQIPEPEIESYFLEVFDRPSRQLICERKNTPTLNQALHMASGDSLQKKITGANGILAKAVASGTSAGRIVEELYLGALSRFPDADERGMAKQAIARAGNEKKGLEDLFWALMSSKEFLYNH